MRAERLPADPGLKLQPPGRWIPPKSSVLWWLSPAIWTWDSQTPRQPSSPNTLTSTIPRPCGPPTPCGSRVKTATSGQRVPGCFTNTSNMSPARRVPGLSKLLKEAKWRGTPFPSTWRRRCSTAPCWKGRWESPGRSTGASTKRPSAPR